VHDLGWSKLVNNYGVHSIILGLEKGKPRMH
jgi:hypothetical protein